MLLLVSISMSKTILSSCYLQPVPCSTKEGLDDLVLPLYETAEVRVEESTEVHRRFAQRGGQVTQAVLLLDVGKVKSACSTRVGTRFKISTHWPK